MFLFYCHTITPRLLYIVDFFSKELFDEPIRITTDSDAFRSSDGPKFNYSPDEFSEAEFYLKNTSLLFETGIKPQDTGCFELNYQMAFFPTSGDFPFDVLAASFYLISRYEEYLPHEKDTYGRFDHRNSLAFREGFLSQPLINDWLEELKQALLKKFPGLLFKRQSFRCLVTYDIDMAWSYRHKGWIRNTGGFLRSAMHGDWPAFRERWRVLSGKQKDPSDCFEWLDALHLYCRLKPWYFFLVARNPSKYDKNISTDVPAFRKLIEYYSRSYKTGLHPSWKSGDQPALLKEEKEWLEVVTDGSVIAGRQHYIRFTLPQTYRQLIEAGIRKEFSMGYPSVNGFRASVCSSFFWYDLERETATSLQVFPFCFMDANALFEQGYSPREAYNELLDYYTKVKKRNGLLVSIWHNFLLGDSRLYPGWNEMFGIFMKETVYWDAFYDAD